MTRFAISAGPLRQRDDGTVVNQEGKEVSAESTFDVQKQSWRQLPGSRSKPPPPTGRRPRKKS
jgi:hypothetical protein